MKFRSLKKWEDPTKCTGLLYFAQILEEMLFDYSLDTYKPSVMHTGLLCHEALQTIYEIELGNIKQPNIYHVVSELCFNYETDPVAKALVPLPPSTFFPTLKNSKSTLQEIKTVVELLSVQLAAGKYRKKNEELLIQEINGPQSISEIRRLGRSYITTLIAIGFNQKYLHDKCLEFFHYGSGRIVDSSAISDFIAMFPENRLKYRVVFRVQKSFELTKTTFSPLGLEITKEIPADLDLSKHLQFSLQKGETVFAVAPEILARDLYSARNSAETLLKLSSTLLNIYHHKEVPDWHPECIVQNIETNEIKKFKNQSTQCTNARI